MYTLTIYAKSMTPYTYGLYENRVDAESALENILMKLDNIEYTKSLAFPTPKGRTAIALGAIEAVVLEEC